MKGRIIGGLLTALLLVVLCAAIFYARDRAGVSDGHIIYPHGDGMISQNAVHRAHAVAASVVVRSKVIANTSADLTAASMAGGPCSLNKVYTVKCMNSTYCCLNGTKCFVGEDGVPTCRYKCPATFPNDCGDGSCCPTGYSCSAYRNCTRSPLDSSDVVTTGNHTSVFCPAKSSSGSSYYCPNANNCTTTNHTAPGCEGAGWGCSESYPVHCLAQGTCCPAGYACLKFGGCGSCDHELKLKTYCSDNVKMWCCDWTASCGVNTSTCIPGCFDADSLVNVRLSSDSEDHQPVIVRKALRQLSIGDYVESFDDSTNQSVFSRVYFIAHQGSTAMANLLDIRFSRSNDHAASLRLTPDHLLFVSKTAEPHNFLLVKAEQVTVGDWIKTSHGSSVHPAQVTGIAKDIGQVRHPLTTTGRIVVSNVVCSVHAGHERLFSIISTPLRLIDTFFPGILANYFFSQPLQVIVSVIEALETWVSKTNMVDASLLSTLGVSSF